MTTSDSCDFTLLQLGITHFQPSRKTQPKTENQAQTVASIGINNPFWKAASPTVRSLNLIWKSDLKWSFFFPPYPRDENDSVFRDIVYVESPIKIKCDPVINDTSRQQLLLYLL